VYYNVLHLLHQTITLKPKAMKKITINNVTYTINPAGYGQYTISNGKQSLHSTDSMMVDAIMDEEDSGYDAACKKLENLFFEEK